LRDVLRRAERLDMAILSVGNMRPDSTAFRFGFSSETERNELIRMGAVGDLLYNFYDISGKLVDHPINQRVMSIAVERLQSVPLRVIASGGLEKIEALIGAIKLVSCNVLITNEATARELLRQRN
jgi:deoxyribonucleoside regulator